MKDQLLSKVVRMAAAAEVAERPTGAHWNALESALGVALPSDFKDLVSAVGTGEFGELCLLNPASSNEYIRFDVLSVDLYGRSIGPIAREAGFRLFPEPGGYLRIGIAGNRMDLLVHPHKEKKAPQRLIWLEQDYARIHGFDMTVAHFLHDLYLGLLPGHWAQETRELLWDLGEKFFRSAANPQM